MHQDLGCCWIVAIAADPGVGLPAFERMRAVDDPDIRWIVRTNLTKRRLSRLLEA